MLVALSRESVAGKTYRGKENPSMRRGSIGKKSVRELAFVSPCAQHSCAQLPTVEPWIFCHGTYIVSHRLCALVCLTKRLNELPRPRIYPRLLFLLSSLFLSFLLLFRNADRFHPRRPAIFDRSKEPATNTRDGFSEVITLNRVDQRYVYTWKHLRLATTRSRKLQTSVTTEGEMGRDGD